MWDGTSPVLGEGSHTKDERQRKHEDALVPTQKAWRHPHDFADEKRT
jgi:hypothetical protein